MVLHALPRGTQTIEFSAVGYVPVERLVNVVASPSAPDSVVLTSLAALDTIRVTARSDPTGFEMRRKGRVGQFITIADIEREKPRGTTELLRSRQQLRLSYDAAGHAYIAVTAGVQSSCRPQLFLDGFPMHGLEELAIPGLSRLDSEIHPDEIGGVEIFVNAAEVPAQFVVDPPASCGVIVFWTRARVLRRP